MARVSREFFYGERYLHEELRVTTAAVQLDSDRIPEPRRSTRAGFGTQSRGDHSNGSQDGESDGGLERRLDGALSQMRGDNAQMRAELGAQLQQFMVMFTRQNTVRVAPDFPPRDRTEPLNTKK